MTPESRQRRIAHLRKLTSQRKDAGVSGRESDRAYLRGNTRLAYGFLIGIAILLCWEIPRTIERHGTLPPIGYIVIITSLFFAATLIHHLIKTRWAMKILDLHHADNLSDIPGDPAPPAPIP